MNEISNHLIVESLGWMLVHSLWLLPVPAFLLAFMLLVLPSAWSRSRYAAGLVALLIMAMIPSASLCWIDLDTSSQEAGLAGEPIESRNNHSGDQIEVASPEYALPVGEEESNSLLETSDVVQVPSIKNASTEDTAVEAIPFTEMDQQEELVAEVEQPVSVAINDIPRLADRARPWLPWLVFAWFIGASLMTTRLLAGWWTARQVGKDGQSAVPEKIHQLFVELRDSIGASKAAQVTQSALVKVPSVVGHFRPIVLLPVSAVTGLNEEQLRAILAHELAHIKRFDYAVNVLQMVIETILFYHPAVWWVSRIVRIERECCCDDIAVSKSCAPAELARALVAVDAVRLAEPRTSFNDILVSATDGGDLLRRIRRISGEPVRGLASRKSWVAGIMALSLLAAVASASMLPSVADKEEKLVDELRAAREGLRDLGGAEKSTGSEKSSTEKSDENIADIKTPTERSNKALSSAPVNVPWPLKKFKSFSKSPPSGSGNRVKIDDRRWVELNSIANMGTKVGDRDLKVFWKSDGTLLNPPDDFDPLELVPHRDDRGMSEEVNREVALQIVAPQGSRIALSSGGGGSYANFSVPVNDEFIQFPIQYCNTGLSRNHTYVEAKVTDGTWENFPIAKGNKVQVIVCGDEHRMVVIADRVKEFAWQAQVQYEEDEKPTLIGPFINGVDQDSNFLNEVRDRLPAFPSGNEACIFAFDKNKPMPRLFTVQRSLYDVVRFDNLAVFPGPKSAVTVSVNGLPVSEEVRLTMSDPDETPPIVPPVSDNPEEGLVELEGTVVDAMGNPVTDCWVGMFVEPQIVNERMAEETPFQPHARFVSEVTTDSNGRFAMLAKKDHFVFEGSFWAIRKDGTSGTLRMNCTWSYLQNHLNIKLVDAVAKIQVLDPDGNPLIGAEVTPEAARKARSVAHIFPALVREKLVKKTDEKGMVQFPGWSSAGIRGIGVKTEAFGTQYLNELLASQWVGDGKPLVLTMRPTASLTGSIVGFDQQQDTGLKLQIRTEVLGEPLPPLYGRAIVDVAEDGTFTVPKIAAGWVNIDSSLGPDSARKIRFHHVPELKTGESRVIAQNPELVDAVRVRQRLIKSDTGEGCPGVRLRILWGEAIGRSGSWDSSKPTITNDEGWWEASVLPGTLNARISGVPEGYRGTAWFDGRNGYLGVKHAIPTTDQVITLPPERYVPAKRMKGRLLLPDGSPANNWRAYGHPVSWNDVGVGGVHTDKNGEFTWTYPVGYVPRLFKVSNRQWLTEHNFEDSYAYPQVISKDPFTIQIVNQESE